MSDDAVRALGPGDEAGVEAFLRARADTTMFLRSNLRAAGLAWSGQPFEGHWAARVEGDGAIAGICCLFWNGMVVVAGDRPEAAARAAVAAAGRPVAGFIGPAAAVAAARAALGLAGAAVRLDDDEILMALDLDALVVPPRLAAGEVTCRRAQAGDVDVLAGWRHDYQVEALHDPPGAATAEEARGAGARGVARGSQWIVVEAGAPVATSGFNAILPEIVQVGPVYTPPALRGRGHGQAAVAGSLLDARAEGVGRAVLFTDRQNPSSTGAYRKIGFAEAGDYALVLLETPAAVRAARDAPTP